ncbi:hypothetical protein [Leeuwenhoekiella marinoflava]|uniref:Uncharacterized protein n=2 Tax=Leeuwenhoekiella marinoflava TaxID=988 RepID=A0A4Q0PPF2_9FLAO|nr:hypothetical protein [Leeuwenhoekiella marinoflava]RXG32363.1 hypothetical protein DSL99_1169 [Leeuwenhoekiella marinoflava]SHE77733.1 hypothetical protein SAMN02745246_00990 [Leeuwenhoekiella marinoflava DSM 3653]
MESFRINARDNLLLEIIAYQIATDQSDYFNRYKRSLHLYESYLFEKLFKMKRASNNLIEGILKRNKFKFLNSSRDTFFKMETHTISNYKGHSIKKYENQKFEVLLNYLNQLENKALQKALFDQLTRINQFVNGLETYHLNRSYVE